MSDASKRGELLVLPPEPEYVKTRWDEQNILQLGLKKVGMSKYMYSGPCPFCKTGLFVVWLDKGYVECDYCKLRGSVLKGRGRF